MPHAIHIMQLTFRAVCVSIWAVWCDAVLAESDKVNGEPTEAGTAAKTAAGSCGGMSLEEQLSLRDVSAWGMDEGQGGNRQHSGPATGTSR
jgi:hypothetical protein